MNSEISETPGTIALSRSSARTVVRMMANIVEMACEHEPDLGLMRLVNFIDLYRTYLEQVVVRQSRDEELMTLAGESSVCMPELTLTDCATFEQFISDSRLLHLAAVAASRESGISVATPPPLKQSANAILNQEPRSCCQDF